MTKTITALFIATSLTLPSFVLGASDNNANSTTTCPSTTTCNSNTGASSCSSKTNGNSCSASDSCASNTGESVERSEAADKALLDTTTGNLEQSRKLLDMSRNLLHASRGIDGIEGIDNTYINAMLNLADDISVMSERIAKSADKVIELDEQNEKDLSSAITASEIILQNNIKLQQNLLEALQKFNNTLTALNQ